MPALKVLILKPSSLGDVIQALPVLRMIRHHLPDSEVHWWLDSGLFPLLEEDPDLKGLIAFERRRWASPMHWHEAWQSVRGIRAHRFDWVIDLQSLARSAVLAWLANGGLTIGLEDTREGAHTFFDAAIPRPSPFTHAVDWYLAVLGVLNVPVWWDFEWLPERPRVSQAVIDKWNPEPGRWIAIQPGARWVNKRWPAERYAEVVREIAGSFAEARFAVLGGMEDQDAGALIAQAAPGRLLDLTGRTSLPEMVEWIRRCELVISNDTGPMHVAAALGKPVIALFGPTEPRRTGPYSQMEGVVQLDLPCVPCMSSSCRLASPLECLLGVSASRVAERVAARLTRTREARG